MKNKNLFNTKNVKGQAAIEFLVTYGWAILGVLIAISALAYFGVFNVSSYTKDYCNLGEQFRCEDYQIISPGTIQFKMRNNFGVAINTSSSIINITIDDIERSCTLIRINDVYCSSFTFYCNVNSGSVFEVLCDTSTAPIIVLTKNDKVNVKVRIGFKKSGGDNPLHYQTGEIYSTVT